MIWVTKPQNITIQISVHILNALLHYTFECQYAKPTNTDWNGSLPQANADDIFIASPLV